MFVLEYEVIFFFDFPFFFIVEHQKISSFVESA